MTLPLNRCFSSAIVLSMTPRSCVPPRISGEFVDYFGKSLSANEMEEKMQKQIAEWERERWWEANMPGFMQGPAGPPKVRKCTPPKAAISA